MKFTLEVNLDLLDQARVADELSRILRYWAANVKHHELTAGEHEKVYDSGYGRVGFWTVTESATART